MRLGVVVLILLAIVFGATFGALNSDRIAFDLYFADFELPKGAALLTALLVGWVSGGLAVWLLRVSRLRRELRAARRTAHELRAQLANLSATDGTPVDGT